MALSFVATSYVGGSLTGTEPTGTTTNDIMVAVVMAGSHTAHTGPAAWTQIDQVDGSNAQRGSTWRIVRSGSAPSLTWGGPSGSDTSIEITTYRGGDTSAPINAHAMAEVSGDSTPDSASVTTTVANTILLCALIHAFEDPVTITIPSGMTSRWNKPSGDWFAGADLAVAATGATGGKTWTEAGGNHNSLMVSIAIAPAAAAGSDLTGGPTLAGVSVAGTLVSTDTLSGGPTLVKVAVAGTLVSTDTLSGGPTLAGPSVAGTLASGASDLSGGPTLAGPSVAGTLASTDTASGGPTLAGVSVAGTLVSTDTASGGPTLAGVSVAGTLVSVDTLSGGPTLAGPSVAGDLATAAGGLYGGPTLPGVSIAGNLEMSSAYCPPPAAPLLAAATASTLPQLIGHHTFGFGTFGSGTFGDPEPTDVSTLTTATPATAPQLGPACS